MIGKDCTVGVGVGMGMGMGMGMESGDWTWVIPSGEACLGEGVALQ